ITNTVLTHPDYSKELYLQTDSSHYAIGGHCYQILENGEKAALVFLSRTLRPAEINYHVSEKECLAIIYCLSKIRHLILGKTIHIITDHQALT
ncbi:RNase H-like domain-containing protein, partial [Klebsiella pneumoniae]|uniref:RNase H-like domain-containing protein n=1 Tax=Klebsiella pneumoniae TaxID=573 RepID=UPI00163DB80A